MVENVAVVGGCGAIGGEFLKQLSDLYPDAVIHCFSRCHPQSCTSPVVCHIVDYGNEPSFESAIQQASKQHVFDMVIVSTGLLHNTDTAPEKSLRELSADNFRCLFEANTILPALLAKHFLPKMVRGKRSVFAVLSARVGSISDNYLGGWYAYRASKAALNMIVKCAAIEVRRQNKKAIIVGLHPGTVDSDLSKPFQVNVPDDKLFSPEFSVQKMLAVIANLTADDTGKCFAWDGLEIEP